MKTNSNSYTIIYSAILVLIVAFLLAFVIQALNPMQDANVQLDQQKQILFALNQDRNMSINATLLTSLNYLTISIDNVIGHDNLLPEFNSFFVAHITVLIERKENLLLCSKH